MEGGKTQRRCILTLHLHLQGGKNHVLKPYLWNFKKLLKTRGNISLKSAWLPTEIRLHCMSICLTTSPDHLLNQLTNTTRSWWSNRCLSFIKFGRWTESLWSELLCSLSWLAQQQHLLSPSHIVKRKCWEEGRRRNGGEGWMCERSGGMAELTEVAVRCAER